MLSQTLILLTHLREISQLLKKLDVPIDLITMEEKDAMDKARKAVDNFRVIVRSRKL
jgi:hypothetical protein